MSTSKKTSKKRVEAAQRYRDRLDAREKARYEEKLQLIGGEDPYEMGQLSQDENLLPSVTYPDIVNYLVFTPSTYTADDLKCYKGLEAYNQMVCGWVRDVQCRELQGNSLVKAKVLHSQRIREKPLEPWVLAEKNGKILACHCTGMAGLGETCTHVAALLFFVETITKLRDSKTVTQEKAYWLVPKSIKNIDYKDCTSIDFTSAKTLKRKLDKSISCPSDMSISSSLATKSVKKTPVPTSDEIAGLFSSLHSTGCKSVILSLVAPYSEEFIPLPEKENFPVVLTELRNEVAMDMNYDKLKKYCESIHISVTDEQAKSVEKATREQANSKLWFRFRSGRITASKMKSVCHTDPTMPAQSLIKSVCYPYACKFSSKATDWGCTHEKIARERFCERIKKIHENVKVEDTGLFINPNVRYIGASPDGLMSCNCCGQSVLEIKCPFCVKDRKIDEIESDKRFCLKKDSEGKLHLDRNHMYFYQVQTQLGVCKLDVAYFVVWTEEDLYFERITCDELFWDEMCQKAKHIFDTAILPELTGNFYTRLPKPNVRKPASNSASHDVQPATSKEISHTSTRKVLSELDVNVVNPLTQAQDNEKPLSETEPSWCYCGQVESGRMVACDNPTCSIEWFHYSCLGISCAPKGKWYCPDCRKLLQFQLRKRRNKDIK